MSLREKDITKVQICNLEYVLNGLASYKTWFSFSGQVQNMQSLKIELRTRMQIKTELLSTRMKQEE